MVTYSHIIEELKIYSAFFEAAFNPGIYGGWNRIWRYKYEESPLLSGRTIFKVDKFRDNHTEWVLYDYSKFATTKITSENYKEFESNYPVRVINGTTPITLSEVREILKNNALAANVASKIEEQIQLYKNLDTMF